MALRHVLHHPACPARSGPGGCVCPVPYTDAVVVLDEEPRSRGARVRDKDGDVWRRGNTRWTCEAVVDGVRVTRVGRLPWYALVTQYGPLRAIAEVR